MRAFSWNCRGLGRPRTVRALVEAIRVFHPQVVCLLETKKGNVGWDQLKMKLGFRNCFTVSCRGKSGGLAVLWADDVNLSICNFSRWHVDMVIADVSPFRLTLFYGDPATTKRKFNWDLLRRLRGLMNLPWAVLGDFNEVLSNEEIKGLKLRHNWQMNNFREVLGDCGLSDLRFRGSPFTFSNRRVGEKEFRARLDRVTADANWRRIFYRAIVSHVQLHASDHQLLVLDTQGWLFNKKGKLFRFEAMWLDHPDMGRLMNDFWSSNNNVQSSWCSKLKDCENMLSAWNRSAFGNVQRRIKDLKVRLEEVKNADRNAQSKEEEEKISEELDLWLAREEVLWLQRSRALWLSQGDKNTKYFHARASHRRKRNWITALRDSQGVLQSDQKVVLGIAAEYFQNLFQTSVDSGSRRWEEQLNPIVSVVTDEMNDLLIADISEEEIRKFVFAQGPLKALGIDGFSGIFYQKYWDKVKAHIISYVRRFWMEGMLDKEMNKTLIVLIPKKKDAEKMEDWRPISLCSVAIKIITKILASRLQPILDRIISTYQSAFIKGRIISDNFIIAHEVYNFLRRCKRSRVSYASIKLDMSKAYDRVEWSFLEAIMRKMGFADKWVDRVMRCVSSVTYLVKVNDHLSDVIFPQRGLRQGDPLSPYLFLLCSELLSAKISAAVTSGSISGVRISRDAPVISHLFFADDSIFFIKARSGEAQSLKRILVQYEEATRQKINFQKSEISFSHNCPEVVRSEILQIFDMKQVDCHSKYLGLPLVMGQRKVEMFGCITDKVWKKINDWKCKFLSAAGREVLIKAVLQALPIYMMSVYRLPERSIQELSRLLLKFWWDKGDKNRGISWVNKETLQKKKMEGGLGFRNLRFFNDAILMKICWRIVKFPNLLVSRILLAKYCPDGTIWSARLIPEASHVWRGVMKVMDYFKGAIWWDADRGTIRWKFSSNGAFSVKSAYELIMQLEDKKKGEKGEQSDASGIIRFWKRVWNCKVPNKIKILCWRAYYNSLPDAMNLRKRGIHMNFCCKICGYKMESAIHVFKDCWWANDLFCKMGISLPLFGNAEWSNPADWIWLCSSFLNDDDFRSFLVSLWLCWRNRNLVWHNKESWSVSRAATIGKSLMKLSDSLSWSYPKDSVGIFGSVHHQGDDVTKISVDGSWEVDARRAGMGVVARDFEGCILWVWARWNSASCCASEAEGIALLQGLRVADKLKLIKVCFVMDSVEVYKAISTGYGLEDWCDSWLEECLDILRRNADWSVSLVYRELNSVADLLAVKARRECWCWDNSDSIPFCLVGCC
ncbi:unnamed protein product [Rhodiola kirilowii]